MAGWATPAGRPVTVLAQCADVGSLASAAEPARSGGVRCGSCGRGVPVELCETDDAVEVRVVGRHRVRVEIQDAEHLLNLVAAGRVPVSTAHRYGYSGPAPRLSGLALLRSNWEDQ